MQQTDAMQALCRVLLLSRSMLPDLESLRYHSSDCQEPCAFCEAIERDTDGGRIHASFLIRKFEDAVTMIMTTLEMGMTCLEDNTPGMPQDPACEKCGDLLIIDADTLELVCRDENCRPIPYVLAHAHAV